MPGNIILINGSIEYYVGDSSMDGLMGYLNEHGYKQKREKSPGVEVEGHEIEEVKKDA